MAKEKNGGRLLKALGAFVIVVAMAAGIFLPWYSGYSLFSIIRSGLGASGSVLEFAAKYDFGAMGGIYTALFVIIGLMAVGALAFGVRTVVTSFGGEPKGMTPCGTLMFVLALAAAVLIVLLGGFGGIQIGLWLCLAAGLASLLWGIFA